MSSKLPILYSRNSDGSIQQWEVEVVGDKFRTIRGRKEGALVTDEFTTCTGKNIGKSNEVTPEQQAVIEATAKWTKKVKSGYREFLDAIDEKRFVEPMLAKEFIKRKDLVRYPVYVDPKYNGVRCILHKDGMFTRTGEKILTAPHIWETLSPLFVLYPRLILDGELYNHELRNNLNDLIKLVRKSKASSITPEILSASRNIVQYHVYDGYDFVWDDTHHDPVHIVQKTLFSLRRDALKKILPTSPYLKIVECLPAKDFDEVMAIYYSHLEAGYEGAMIRTNSSYENKRSSNLLKLKPFDDAEFEVIDVEEGNGNRSGMAGRVICKMDGGKVFAAGVKGTSEQFVTLLQNKHAVIGKKVTFTYNGLTGLGTPNFAQFDCSNWDKGDR